MVSGVEVAMSLELSLELVVAEGKEAGSWLGAVNTQPPAGLARIISNVIISARYHLSRFMFALRGI
jgi:hypothetical protein